MPAGPPGLTMASTRGSAWRIATSTTSWACPRAPAPTRSRRPTGPSPASGTPTATPATRPPSSGSRTSPRPMQHPGQPRESRPLRPAGAALHRRRPPPASPEDLNDAVGQVFGNIFRRGKRKAQPRRGPALHALPLARRGRRRAPSKRHHGAPPGEVPVLRRRRRHQQSGRETCGTGARAPARPGAAGCSAATATTARARASPSSTPATPAPAKASDHPRGQPCG